METDTVLERVEQPVEKAKTPPTKHLCCSYCKTIVCRPSLKAINFHKHTEDSPVDCLVCHDLWDGWILPHLAKCEKAENRSGD